MIKYLWRWHPEVALRYLPIVKKIKNLKIPKPSVLEIGSGSLGIVPYLGRPVTAVDIDFSGPQIDLLTKVRGSAVKLPIVNQSFDVVLMIDVLEHIPEDKRLQAIKEAIRVTKYLLVIAVPCGELSGKEDHYLARYYKKIYGKNFSFYEDHLKYGLPKKEWINDKIREISRKYKRTTVIETEGNINLSLHRFLMKGWMTKNFIIDVIFRKFFLIFIPIMLLLNNEPTYRKIFYIEFKK